MLSADRWIVCSKGHVHWGALGGAGLLLRHAPASGAPEFLLTQRSRTVDQAGTWGVPGGAIREGESPEVAALREAREELAVLPVYRIMSVEVQDCGGGWLFHLVQADVDFPFTAYCGQETDATGWFTIAEMKWLPLHTGLKDFVAAARARASAR